MALPDQEPPPGSANHPALPVGIAPTMGVDGWNFRSIAQLSFGAVICVMLYLIWREGVQTENLNRDERTQRWETIQEIQNKCIAERELRWKDVKDMEIRHHNDFKAMSDKQNESWNKVANEFRELKVTIIKYHVAGPPKKNDGVEESDHFWLRLALPHIRVACTDGSGMHTCPDWVGGRD